MANNTHVPAEQLAPDIADGVIDTVIVAFGDHQGRLVGKRTDGDFYLDVVAAEGTENCDYLIACDLDNTPIPASAGRATTRATATCAASSTRPRSVTSRGWRRSCSSTSSTSTRTSP